jgi:hypothetical protein
MCSEHGNENRLDRIRKGIAKNAGTRRNLVDAALGTGGQEAPGKHARIIHQIVDGWLLSEFEISAMFQVPNSPNNAVDLQARIDEIQAVDSALSRTFGEDLENKIRWLRDANSELGGFQPLEYLRSFWGDELRIIRLLEEREEA